MTHRIQLRYQNQPVQHLHVIIKTWDCDYIIYEQHLYSDENGFITIQNIDNIQVCIDDRSIFKDFLRGQVSAQMDVDIDEDRYALLLHKLNDIVSHYEPLQSNDLDKLYCQYQKIMGIETYPIHHYFILSIINQMYLELQ